MANVFLNQIPRDIETAIMLENANVLDIGNAVAYTDGNKIFVNTDDNLFKILPAYDHKMLKWLLWHERFHNELRHHNRFFKYLQELDSTSTEDEFHVTKEEVNIIMDILVHDSLSKMFPELIETAQLNLAQFRNRNSLGYTFKTFTLEEMLTEYSEHKHPEDKGKSSTSDEEEGKEKDKSSGKSKERKPTKSDSKADEGDSKSDKKGHGESHGHEDTGDGKEKDDTKPETKDALEPEHDKTDWSKLKDIDDKEFITEDESRRYIEEINRIKRLKARLGKLTETLNGLVTSQRNRTYSRPSYIQTPGAVLKGSKPGRVALWLCFDASGSMGRQMETFKDIISKSIPQAMETPTSWFSGDGAKIKHDPAGRNSDYYKGQFKDFMSVHADCGYSDDGDRTIELCWKAEQLGYTPIGVTDGGGQISWSKDKLKALRKTILVGQSKYWLEEVNKINPSIQTIHI